MDENEIVLNQHLDNDEKLLWYGKPKPGISFGSHDIFLIPFSILWCGFAIFWFVGASNAAGAFGLFGIPFVIIGLYIVFGRFIYDMKLRQSTIYGITNDRIIIISGIFNKKIQSVNIRTITNLEFSTKKDGSGTIHIGPKNPAYMWGSSMSWYPGMKATPSLDLIPDVTKVYRMITDLQKSKI